MRTWATCALAGMNNACAAMSVPATRIARADSERVDCPRGFLDLSGCEHQVFSRIASPPSRKRLREGGPPAHARLRRDVARIALTLAVKACPRRAMAERPCRSAAPNRMSVRPKASVISQPLAVPGSGRSCSSAGLSAVARALMRCMTLSGRRSSCSARASASAPKTRGEVPALGQHGGDLARVEPLAGGARRRLVDGDEAGEARDEMEVERGLEHARIDRFRRHAGVAAFLDAGDLGARPELGDAGRGRGVGQRKRGGPGLAVEAAGELEIALRGRRRGSPSSPARRNRDPAAARDRRRTPKPGASPRGRSSPGFRARRRVWPTAR